MNSVYLWNNFHIRCGTVCYDFNTGRVLVFYDPYNHEYSLPKGPMYYGETSYYAAMRETWQQGRLHRNPRLVTTSVYDPGDIDSEDDPPEPFYEPIAIQQRMVLDKCKLIIWHLACSRSIRERVTYNPERDWCDTRWIPINQCVNVLSFPDERAVVQQASACLTQLPLRP